MNIHIQAEHLKWEMERLLLEYPELVSDDELRADMFEGETDLHKVLSTAVDVEQEAKAMAAGCADKIKLLSQREKRFERKADAIRSLIKGIMEKAQQIKVTLPQATLSISTRKPTAIITDEHKVPMEFMKATYAPSMTKIKEALNNEGTNIAGVSLSEPRPSLTIRRT